MNIEAAKRSLIGTLIGDSLGLPYEKLSARRAIRLLPFPLRQRLLVGHGVPSDDTVQSVFVMLALSEPESSLERFQRSLASLMRIWFLSAPPGIGLSTLKACVKLCMGMGPKRSGVSSEGNGAAMRSAVIGCLLAHDEAERVRFVEASTVVTHRGVYALHGAQLVALAAAMSTLGTPELFDQKAGSLCPEWPWTVGWPQSGPSGYVVHSVNATIHLWKSFRHDPKRAIEEAVRLGGDTDTVCAMLGGILGAAATTQWPESWMCTVGFPTCKQIERLPNIPRANLYPLLLVSNLIAFPAILLFGLRRLLPPY